MSGVTRILSQIESGDPSAADKLLPLVYDELRKLAAARLAHERVGQTLQATALVHEAYLRLVSKEEEGESKEGSEEKEEGGRRKEEAEEGHWNSRGHFFAAAAEAMRRILVEAARRKGSLKRGAGRQPTRLLEGDAAVSQVLDEVLDLDQALTKLRAVDQQAAELVTLRVFAGMTVEEAAELLGVSARTAKRNWAYARAWLGRELNDYAESD